MSRRYIFGELEPLSAKMNQYLPGARLESGYAIDGPDDGGYFGIKGPNLPSPAFTSGRTAFHHPETKQLLFQPYIPPAPKKKPERGFPVLGWLVVVILVMVLINN